MARDHLPIIVSFSGIDGAGKSTQIQHLCNRLASAGYHVIVRTFWDDVAVLWRARAFFSQAVFKSETGVGTPGAPVRRRDKNVQAWYMTPARCFLYFLDAVSLSISVARTRGMHPDVILFDRYLYDELANLRLQHRAHRVYARCLASLVPRPHVAYLLDANPVQAVARKPEYPVEFLHSNREAYLTLSRLACMTVVGPDSADRIARRVAEEVLRRTKRADPHKTFRDRKLTPE
jgi:thymidylate kinase